MVKLMTTSIPRQVINAARLIFRKITPVTNSMANAVKRKMQANSRVSPSLASPAFWAKIKMQGYRLVSITATSPTAQLFRCPRSVFMGQRPPKFRTSSVTAFSAFLSTPARKFVTLYSIIHSLICNHNFHRFHTFYCIIYKNAIGILCNVHRTAQGGSTDCCTLRTVPMFRPLFLHSAPQPCPDSQAQKAHYRQCRQQLPHKSNPGSVGHPTDGQRPHHHC